MLVLTLVSLTKNHMQASNFNQSLSFVTAACSEAQVSNTNTENDDIHLQVSLSWHGIHWITDASSKLLGYIMDSKLPLQFSDLTSLIPIPHTDFLQLGQKVAKKDELIEFNGRTVGTSRTTIISWVFPVEGYLLGRVPLQLLHKAQEYYQGLTVTY